MCQLNGTKINGRACLLNYANQSKMREIQNEYVNAQFKLAEQSRASQQRLQVTGVGGEDYPTDFKNFNGGGRGFNGPGGTVRSNMQDRNNTDFDDHPPHAPLTPGPVPPTGPPPMRTPPQQQIAPHNVPMMAMPSMHLDGPMNPMNSMHLPPPGDQMHGLGLGPPNQFNLSRQGPDRLDRPDMRGDMQGMGMGMPGGVGGPPTHDRQGMQGDRQGGWNHNHTHRLAPPNQGPNGPMGFRGLLP